MFIHLVLVLCAGFSWTLWADAADSCYDGLDVGAPARMASPDAPADVDRIGKIEGLESHCLVLVGHGHSPRNYIVVPAKELLHQVNCSISPKFCLPQSGYYKDQQIDLGILLNNQVGGYRECSVLWIFDCHWHYLPLSEFTPTK